MKARKMQKKLALDKQTIANLTKIEANAAKGGFSRAECLPRTLMVSDCYMCFDTIMEVNCF